MTKDTTRESDKKHKKNTQESQEVSPFQADDSQDCKEQTWQHNLKTNMKHN